MGSHRQMLADVVNAQRASRCRRSNAVLSGMQSSTLGVVDHLDWRILEEPG
jgi:hypothetical protein